MVTVLHSFLHEVEIARSDPLGAYVDGSSAQRRPRTAHHNDAIFSHLPHIGVHVSTLCAYQCLLSVPKSRRAVTAAATEQASDEQDKFMYPVRPKNASATFINSCDAHVSDACYRCGDIAIVPVGLLGTIRPWAQAHQG